MGLNPLPAVSEVGVATKTWTSPCVGCTEADDLTVVVDG
jgi:hypothetical protein